MVCSICPAGKFLCESCTLHFLDSKGEDDIYHFSLFSGIFFPLGPENLQFLSQLRDIKLKLCALKMVTCSYSSSHHLRSHFFWFAWIYVICMIISNQLYVEITKSAIFFLILRGFKNFQVRTVLVGWFYCLVTRCKWFSCKKRSDGIAISGKGKLKHFLKIISLVPRRKWF